MRKSSGRAASLPGRARRQYERSREGRRAPCSADMKAAAIAAACAFASRSISPRPPSASATAQSAPRRGFYTSQCRARRTVLHAAIGAVLEHDPEAAVSRPALLGHHFAQAGDAEKASLHSCALASNPSPARRWPRRRMARVGSAARIPLGPRTTQARVSSADPTVCSASQANYEGPDPFNGGLT